MIFLDYFLFFFTSIYSLAITSKNKVLTESYFTKNKVLFLLLHLLGQIRNHEAEDESRIGLGIGAVTHIYILGSQHLPLNFAPGCNEIMLVKQLVQYPGQRKHSESV